MDWPASCRRIGRRGSQWGSRPSSVTPRTASASLSPTSNVPLVWVGSASASTTRERGMCTRGVGSVMYGPSTPAVPGAVRSAGRSQAVNAPSRTARVGSRGSCATGGGWWHAEHFFYLTSAGRTSQYRTPNRKASARQPSSCAAHPPSRISRPQCLENQQRLEGNGRREPPGALRHGRRRHHRSACSCPHHDGEVDRRSGLRAGTG